MDTLKYDFIKLQK
jgi:hypothetical protein